MNEGKVIGEVRKIKNGRLIKNFLKNVINTSKVNLRLLYVIEL